MDTLADYEAWKAKQQQSSVGAASVVLSATDGKPDEIASDLNLANEFGKATGNPIPPLPLVQEARSVFQAEIERQKNSTILSQSPRLAEWLRNPENASVAKDDLSGLSWWETPLAAAKNAVSRGVQRLPMIYNQQMANDAAQRLQDQGRSFGDILASETDVRDGNGTLLYNNVPGPIDLFKAGSRFATSRFSKFVGPDAAKNSAAYYQQQVGIINKRIAEIPMSPAGEQGRANWLDVKPSGDTLADLGSYMQAIGKDPKAFAAFAAETAAESLPSLAAATAVTFSTGSPVAGAVSLGVSSAATEKGTAPADVFKEHGLDISTPDGALAAISNPDLMREAIKRGNVRGMIVGMMDGLSGGLAGKMLVESHLGNMVLQSLTQAAMGAAGEAGGQYFSGQELSLGDILMEGLAEFATAPIEVVGVGGRKFIDASAKAKAAGDRKSLFEALSGQAQSSVLRGRMPQKFREFVAEATKDGPVTNVFVPADKFTEYFQSIGVDPHELVDSLEGVTRDDLDAALAGGGDLQIPTATYAAHIAGSEHDAFLMENMRFDPDEFTSAEAAEFNERANDALQEAWEVAEQLRQQDEQLRSFEQEIYDTMVSRLRAAGRSTDVATTEAMLYPAFYRVMAQRSGLTTEEFMQQYPLPGVRGALPEGMQLRDVDALTRTLAEARSAKTVRDKRQTLLEFISDYGGINDAGGELAARDATVVNRGKGKKSLRLARKGFVAGQSSMLPAGDGKRFGADDVALAAVENGFMADNPTVQEYMRAREEGRQTPDLTAALWDAVDDELAGTPQFSSQQAADPAIENAEALGDLERYLAEAGVSLDDDDATIRKALEAAGGFGGGSDVAPSASTGSPPSKEISDFLGAVDDLKSRLGIQTRQRVFRQGDLPSMSETDQALALREEIESTKGSRLTIVQKHVAAFGGDAEAIVAAIGKADAVDVKAASVEDLQRFVIALEDLQQVVEDRVQAGYDLAEQVVFARDAVVEKLDEISSRMDEIASEADDLASSLSDKFDELDARREEILDEKFGDDEVARQAYEDAIEAGIKETSEPSIAEEIIGRDDGQSTALEVLGRDRDVGAAYLERYDVRASQALSIVTDSLDLSGVEQALADVAAVQRQMASVKYWMDKHAVMASDASERAIAAVDHIHDNVLMPDVGRLEDARETIEAKVSEVDDRLNDVTQARAGMSFEQFAGIGAKTADMGGLTRAVDMRRVGKSREEIYSRTGFFVGPDGLWRFEISDADAKIKEASLQSTMLKSAKRYDGMLSGLLQHKRLFDAYPIVATIPVQFVFGPTLKLAGQWDGDTIKVTAPTISEARSVLLHEIAHVVQDEEGFAPGGNPSMGELYEGPHVEAFKKEAADLIKEWDALKAKIASATNASELAVLNSQVPTLAAQMQAIHKGLTRAARMEFYKHIAGEVEARNVQRRDELERAAIESGNDDFSEFPGGIDAPWWTADVSPDKVIMIRSDKSRAGFNALSTPMADDAGTQYFQAQSDQTAEKGARGLIQFPAAGVGNGDTIIRLFETANLSTVAHESGHYFLAVMQDLAKRGEAEAIADVTAIRDWWRANAADVAKDATRATKGVAVVADDVTTWIDTGTTGDAVKDRAIEVGGHEQFARGFEAYLMEGRAPNEELRSAFEKFRAWLVSVYQRLTRLNVNISDDIRRVFDRMVATDEEIAKAQADVGSSPVFATAEQLGLTADEYANLMKLRAQSEDGAKARLLREIMEPIKREKEKWFKEERAKVKKQVETQVNAYPYYRAIEWMGNKRWIGEGQSEDMPDMRLSKDILVARYGAGVLKTLPRGKQTIYTVAGGIDPDEAAGWFGFDSGDAMIQAMERAPKRNEAIDAETDHIMRDRHGDVLNDGALEAEAMEAVHIDKRGQWIAAELKAVSEVAGREFSLTAKEAKASARQTIARMRVRDAIATNRFLAAERKAAAEAERVAAQLARSSVWLTAANRRVEAKARAAAKGKASPDALAKEVERRNDALESRDTNVVRTGRGFGADGGQFITATETTAHTAGYNELVSKLIDAKRRQLLNHALYVEARKVADEVEKAENYVQRLNKKAARDRIAGAGRRENASIDYLGAIDEILERYDFRKISNAAEQRRGTLNAFIEAMKAAGRENELAIPESVLADAARKPYKALPVELLRGVIDSLKNLEHVATRWDKLIDAQNERALDEVVTGIAEAFEANMPKRPPGRVKTRGEAVRNAGRQFLDLVLNATTLLREIDGFADLGVTYRNIKSPIDAAMSRLIVRKEDAAAALQKIYSVYSKAERREMAVRRYIPAVGISLSKWERIVIALNTGNEGNMQRLTDPKVRGAFTETQVAAVLATLDERDADFVQSVWNYVGSFRADIAAREKRATGVEPKWVEASPVTIAGKVLAGGYYPIRYDPRLSSLSRDDQAQEIAQSLQAGRFGKAQTRNGHLKERAQSSGRTVELDMSVLHRHINQVIYDIELSEAVANSWRILQDNRIRDAFTDAGRQSDFDALESWLKDVAEGELRSGDFISRAARVAKSNFTAAKLAFNLVTVASQVTGLAQTMVVVGKRDFVRGLQASLRPDVIGDITAKSAFMSTRETTFNKDINDFYNDPKIGPVASRWGDIKSEWIGPAAFWLMTKVQWYTVDVPTWLAGYQQGLRKFGNDEAKAVSHADDVVKRAQASGLFSDRSAIERGSVNKAARQNDVVRLFTALGSYMFAKFNVAYERTGKASRVIRQEGVNARSATEVAAWTIDMVFLFTLEAVVMAAIRGQLPGGDDDDDNDKADGWGAFLAKQTGLSVLGTVPLVRDLTSALQGFDGGGAYGGVMGDTAKGVKGAWNILTSPFANDGDGIKRGDVKGVIAATGLATGLPATQVNRAVDALARQRDGEDVSPLEYILGRRAR